MSSFARLFDVSDHSIISFDLERLVDTILPFLSCLSLKSQMARTKFPHA